MANRNGPGTVLTEKPNRDSHFFGFPPGVLRGFTVQYFTMQHLMNLNRNRLRAGMVGLGMIFDETYRPLFEQLRGEGLYRRDFGLVDVELAAVASRTGARRAPATKFRRRLGPFANCRADAIDQLLAEGVDAVCVATPDDRHFDAARRALLAGKHVLIEKPSVLRCRNWMNCRALARRQRVLAKVVYHKLPTPITRSCARTSPTACCSTSTTATARCWSRSRSAAASSPSGSPAAIPAPTSPSITSS